MTTIAVAADAPLLNALLARADDALVHAHRLSEWTGHAPMLEEELALANVALDLLGQARSLYQYAAAIEGAGRTEDDYAICATRPPSAICCCTSSRRATSPSPSSGCSSPPPSSTLGGARRRSRATRRWPPSPPRRRRRRRITCGMAASG
jgi:hypothetical protein